MIDELSNEFDEWSVFVDEKHPNHLKFWIIVAKFLPSEQKLMLGCPNSSIYTLPE